jgi:hypothetical protein
VTTGDNWIGDIGHLALADSALGALLTDMLQVLAEASYPEPSTRVDVGMTTKQAARRLQRCVEADPGLFPDPTSAWLEEVVRATELRNSILHAVAVNRCANCGAASHFVHPRSGSQVDRTDEAVRTLTSQLLALRPPGMLIAEGIAERVNAQIVDRARITAYATDDIQNPPQIYPHRSVALCVSCAGNGRGSITTQVGTAVEVLPRERYRAMVARLREQQAAREDDPSEGSSWSVGSVSRFALRRFSRGLSILALLRTQTNRRCSHSSGLMDLRASLMGWLHRIIRTAFSSHASWSSESS